MNHQENEKTFLNSFSAHFKVFYCQGSAILLRKFVDFRITFFFSFYCRKKLETVISVCRSLKTTSFPGKIPKNFSSRETSKQKVAHTGEGTHSRISFKILAIQSFLNLKCLPYKKQEMREYSSSAR